MDDSDFFTGTMDLDKDVAAAHRDLSESSAKFVQFALSDPRVKERSNFNRLFKLNIGKVRMQPWPTIINQHTRDMVTNVSQGIFNLIKSIPERIFGNDPKKICDYYKIPGERAEYFLTGIGRNYLDAFIGRGDFLFSPAGLKCLEYNFSSSLGGWDIDFYKDAYLETPVVAEFFKAHRVKVINKSLLDTFLEHLIEQLAKTFPEVGQRVHAAFVFVRFSGSYDSDFKRYVGRAFNDLLRRKLDRDVQGEILFCDCSHLQVKEGFVFCGEKKVYALIKLFDKDIPEDILGVFKAGNLDLYNGPLEKLLGNKLNLAILSENQDSDIFSPDEREVIKNHIPWTRKINHDETTYGSETVKLMDFICFNREKLVIKPPSELGGRNVYIGPHVSKEEWIRVLIKAMDQENWLVQEYYDSLPYLHQTGEKAWAEHNAAWGIFSFGTRYAGAWVRVLPQQHTRGVINRAQGAEECFVFEVEE